MFRDTLHKIKIFFCDDDIEKIHVRDSTVIRNNEIHKMYDDPRADINQFDFKYDSILSAASLGVCSSHSHAVSSSGILNNSQYRFS